jgi:hypothetical protein
VVGPGLGFNREIVGTQFFFLISVSDLLVAGCFLPVPHVQCLFFSPMDATTTQQCFFFFSFFRGNHHLLIIYKQFKQFNVIPFKGKVSKKYRTFAATCSFFCLFDVAWLLVAGGGFTFHIKTSHNHPTPETQHTHRDDRDCR